MNEDHNETGPDLKGAIIMGDEQARLNEGKIAYGVAAVFDIRGGERTCTTTYCVHEFVVMRRHWRAVSGDLEFLESWPPLSRRTIGYNRYELEANYKHMYDTAVKRTEHAELHHIEDVYGAAGESTMYQRMKEIYHTYIEYVKNYQRETGKNDYPMTQELWDKLCAIADPTPIGNWATDTIDVMPDFEAQIEAETKRKTEVKSAQPESYEKGTDAGMSPYIETAAFEFVSGRLDGLKPQQIKGYISAVASHNWMPKAVTNEDWADIRLRAKEARRELESVLLEYMDEADPAPTPS